MCYLVELLGWRGWHLISISIRAGWVRVGFAPSGGLVNSGHASSFGLSIVMLCFKYSTMRKSCIPYCDIANI